MSTIKASYVCLPQCVPETKPDKTPLVLDHDWFFYVNGTPYCLPSGYSIDGASIPRAVWWIIGSPFEPAFWAAAFAHDALYLTHALDRSTADEILFQFLLHAGVSKMRARIMWGAVRSCAGFAWKNNSEDIKAFAEERGKILAMQDNKRFLSLWFPEIKQTT